MSEEDKPRRAAPLNARRRPAPQQFITGRASGSFDKGHLFCFIFFFLSSDYCPGNTAPATCHCLFFTRPRSAGILRSVRSLFSVPVPEVSPRGLFDKERESDLCAAWPAFRLRVSSGVRLICGGLSPAFRLRVSLDLMLCHHKRSYGGGSRLCAD